MNSHHQIGVFVYNSPVAGFQKYCGILLYDHSRAGYGVAMGQRVTAV
jgi:hypothetical protein